MHIRPVPAGAGGIAVVVALAFWLAGAGAVLTPVHITLSVAAGALALNSWADDMRGLPVWLRLAAQILAIAACLSQISPQARALPALPLMLERGLEAMAWLWFVNLFNFMDGIDGLAGSEAATVAIGYVAVMALVGASAREVPLAVFIAATMLGYLFWNWHPARVMMGDAGSIPIGFLVGWLMLDLCLRGLMGAALILPLYFCADSTYTLIARVIRGEAPHAAHRQHYYQRAALGCGSHAPVVSRVLVADAGLTMLPLGSVWYPWAAVAGAIGIVLWLIRDLGRLACQAKGDGECGSVRPT
jgi:UDP-N-acetylmuramyl pentapeptide phosphotransferase/UDP-N-acetylglucosamine-1-phosphate transferase